MTVIILDENDNEPVFHGAPFETTVLEVNDSQFTIISFNFPNKIVRFDYILILNQSSHALKITIYWRTN